MAASVHAGRLRRLIEAAMELERRTMQLYCMFESQFARNEELQNFWFDMAQHESRHFGALAFVSGLLDSSSDRELPLAPSLTPARIKHLRGLLDSCLKDAARGVSVERAFEIALDIEGSEIEDVVLDLLQALKGDAERERAAKLLIHDLGDLSYMIEKHTHDQTLLERADTLLQHRVDGLQVAKSGARRALRSVRK